ncbi:MAG TPA: hypothetical protein VH599_01705 [Ktedonobacterales bacterium]|jgi:hypothetical protein
MGIKDLLNKLEAAEQDFLASEVLAPVLPGQAVTVRITGIVCRLHVDNQRFEGWAIMRPLSTSQARIVRPARLAEVSAFLKLFPATRLIAVLREGRRWHGLAAQKGDTRFRIDRPMPALLAEESIQPFETLLVRFDGRFFWYERRDPRRNPALAAYLRQALNDRVAPGDLHKSGLSAEERAAYTWAWGLLEEVRKSAVEQRLADALMHAGGQLEAFTERDEAYTITYEVDGSRHVSTVRKNDLTVLTAGICLSGQDQRFDLTSLVGVVREAAARRGIVRVGDDGIDEEAYWRVHPAPEGEG